ncbi:DNA translocase FtsK 4TM domain-containing protein, partial [Luedemannella flava]|uniref:DNA translocase FtsK 4TM domain-containing protein n=1 Tax=Luedemannella flava TaxID=349316 RepID=UPI0031E13C69
MAGRTSPASRRSGAASSRAAAAGRSTSTTRRTTASTRATTARGRRVTARRTAAARRRTAAGPLSYLGAAIGSVWMGLAHAVGWGFRAVGRQAATARDIDPEQRRDGADQVVSALATILAVAVWFGSAGPVGDWLAKAARFSIGELAKALPLLLLVAAVRLMRVPPDEEHRGGRGLVGWGALGLAAAGLLHLGRKQPTDGWLIEHAGGWLGRGVGTGLATAITSYVAVPLLILLGLFGVLVLTSTPVNQVPHRLWALWNYLVGAPPETDDKAPPRNATATAAA